MPRRLTIWLLTPALLLAACGQTSTSGPSAGGPASPSPTSASAPVSVPATSLTAGPRSSQEQAVEAARAALAKQLGTGNTSITLVSVQPKEWPNAALGCPQPGMGYAEVITPGYLVTLLAGGKKYSVHTDSGRTAVVCQPAAGPTAGAAKENRGVASDSASTAAVKAATVEVARKAGVKPDAVELVSVQPKDWPDTSLGCPEKGMMYAQVITAGYLVVLKADGKQYEVHTDRGRQAVVCDKPSGPTS